ncbi:Glycosyltransferase involved in cell wall bisynthesis [Jatrophihabitans endophyticus]|uniref:Glycosyltransferase involved in cell wall bisynthesis n=1 Tax=Jatrophihabitans endophyticus TaxID=1206085 RepID=A0A1M5IKV9_9ACTN|nr:glycosyltransferase [Jatrophihabitans endophyticus]SHG28885.1 Glycosyltransferase involved in cell wall bisynthesis [Jatrophihabitans endophyticus]
MSPTTYDLSVVVPTRHEATNIDECHRRVAAALGDDVTWELLFVDDSDDETPQVIEALCRRDSRVKLCHRSGESRTGGLGGAVTRGFALSTGDAVVVMDADLQHPPAVVPELHAALLEGADVAVASRYVGDGSTAGLDGRYRQGVSRLSKTLARRLLPRIRHTTDPLSGFFAVRRGVIAGASLRPDGYKILMEILARGSWDSLVDVPYTFSDRHSGDSKSDVREGLRFVRHTFALRRRSRGRSGDAARRVRGESPDGLRVLILTSEAPPVVSGIAKTVEMLQRGLRERGHEVDITSRQDFPRLMRREIRLSAFAFFWPRVARDLPTYDVVNLHGPVPTISETFLLLIRTMRRAERPAVVYTHHSDLAIPRLERWCGIYNRLAKALAHSADAVVVSSSAYQSKIGRTDGKAVEVIPWAVEAPAKAPVRAASPRMRVLFVGQLRSYKGLHVLIDAVAQLPEIDLTIVGDGPLRDELSTRIRSHGAANITMAGRLSDDELWQSYGNHDVITLPSLTRAEAYGMVLAEGMAAGCVPIASDLPGVAEVASPTGVVVEPGSVDSLRDSLAELQHDRGKLDRLSRASVERARSLTVDGMASSYEAVFSDGVRTRSQERGRLAVPERWSGPQEVVHALENALPDAKVSVALVTRTSRQSSIRVWCGGEQIATSDYDAARYAFDLSEPEVVASAGGLDAGAKILLDEQGATSAIFIPMRKNRGTVSVIGVSSSDDARRLGDADLDRAMAVLRGLPKERFAA